jgi:hypothetical protein
LIGLIDSLESTLRGLTWTPGNTGWAHLETAHNYTASAAEYKARLVAGPLERIRHSMTWDLGANVGLFSRLAAEAGSTTIAFDLDPRAVEIHVRRCRASGERQLLPLLLDRTNPSPAQGWNYAERLSLAERGPADAVLALAPVQETYTRKKRLGAQQTAVSDLCFTPAFNTLQTAAFASQLMVSGVQSVTAAACDVQALVGSEKHTVYGIDVSSFRQAAYLPGSFVVDGASLRTIRALTNRTSNYAPSSTRQVLDALASTPDGVIISVEQPEKYNFLVGDPVMLRLYNRVTKQDSDVQVRAMGLAVCFPTSSQDSDFILNRDFMLDSTGSQAVDYFLIKIKTDGRPSTHGRVASTLTETYENLMPVRIGTTETLVKTGSSSLTSMNLSWLGTMERLYTILVTSVGLAIFLLAMVYERQREFGATRALGANVDHLRRFLFVEAATIGGLSLLIGAMVGLGLAFMRLMLLGVIFPIPAHGLSWPVLQLFVLAGLAAAGMVASSLVSARRLARLKVVEALREL